MVHTPFTVDTQSGLCPMMMMMMMCWLTYWEEEKTLMNFERWMQIMIEMFSVLLGSKGGQQLSKSGMSQAQLSVFVLQLSWLLRQAQHFSVPGFEIACPETRSQSNQSHVVVNPVSLSLACFGSAWVGSFSELMRCMWVFPLGFISEIQWQVCLLCIWVDALWSSILLLPNLIQWWDVKKFELEHLFFSWNKLWIGNSWTPVKAVECISLYKTSLVLRMW